MAIQKRTADKESHSIGFGKIKAQIEKRANEIFLNRLATRAKGDALSDWLKAEKEVKARHLLP